MPDLTLVWINEDSANEIEGTSLESANFNRIFPSVNAQHKRFIQSSAARGGFVLKADTCLKLIIDGTHHVCAVRADTLFTAADLLDEDAALLSGRDYYIYACYDDTDPLNIGLSLKVSLNSTYPAGWDENTSRKIGGFHTLCAAVGTISGHPLSGYAAGDILPASFWCLTHRPYPANPEGMVYVEPLDIWVDIYLQSGTGTQTKSVYGATITDTRTYMDHVDDMAAVGKGFLNDEEFQIAGEGSNQKTNIAGSADPVTTGGHSDTAGRRMITRYGIEDIAGAMWQWITGGGWMSDGTAWSTDWPGGKGEVYGSGKDGLLAGGYWGNAAYCGSRCRYTNHARSYTSTYFGGRGRARSL
jgi:hypothetical protein